MATFKKNQWIYWRWKHESKSSKSFTKSRIQDIVKTDKGDMLELTSDEVYTHYPLRVLTKEIEIITKK